MEKNILIIYASIGAGHYMAAKGLEDNIKEIHPKSNITLLDVIELLKIEKLRDLLTNFHQTSSIGPIYDSIWNRKDVVNVFSENILKPLVPHKKVRQILQTYNPHMIFCTHGLACVTAVASKPSAKTKIYAVITDYGTHGLWPKKNVDGYLVPKDMAHLDLKNLGYPLKKIHTVGIPLRKQFLQNFDSYPLNKNPVITIMLGGKKSEYSELINDNLVSFLKKADKAGLHVNVVCGKDEDMKKMLDGKVKKLENIKIYGYVSDMISILKESHFVLCKSNSLICEEAIATRTIPIFINTGWGQERTNADFLISKGAGLKIENLDGLLDTVKSFDSSKYTEIMRIIETLDYRSNLADFIKKLK